MVTKVTPEVANRINPGDTIVEVNGYPVHSKGELYGVDGEIRLKLVTSTIYSAPMVFCRALADYNPNDGKYGKNPIEILAMNIKRGDIMQILSTNGEWMQVRQFLWCVGV